MPPLPRKIIPMQCRLLCFVSLWCGNIYLNDELKLVFAPNLQFLNCGAVPCSSVEFSVGLFILILRPLVYNTPQHHQGTGHQIIVVCNVLGAVCTVYCVMSSVQYSVIPVWCAVCSVHCELCSAQCAVCSVQCIIWSVKCVVCCV